MRLVNGQRARRPHVPHRRVFQDRTGSWQPVALLRSIGLLKPAHIDQWTGYRYYSAKQLPRLHRILALKELGLTLEQITRLVEEEVSAAEIRGMLTLKKAQVEQTVQEEMTRLRSLEARLQ